MSVNRLEYLDLALKPRKLCKLDSINFVCFSPDTREHLLHSGTPQLNFITDIVLSVLSNQRLQSTNIEIGHLRDISDKLEYLRVQKSSGIQNTFTSIVEKLEGIEQKLSCLETIVVSMQKSLEKIL